MLGWLHRLMARFGVGGAGARGHAAGGGADYFEGPDAAVAFKARLAEILKHQGTATAGAVHAVELARLRQRLGDTWREKGEAVEAGAAKIIQRHLVQGDIFTKFDGPIFLIVFASLTKEKATLKCAMIAAEIERRYLGEEGSGTAPGTLVRAAVARLEDGLRIDTIDLGALAAHVIAADAAEAAEDALRPPAPPAADGAAPPTETLLGILPAAGHSQLPEILRRKRRGCDDDLGWRPLPREEGIDLSGTLFFYRPTWNVKRQAVSMFHLVAEHHDGWGTPVPEPCGPAGRLVLDGMVARRVRDDLAVLAAAGRKLLLSFPVHFSSLADPRHRPQILGVLQQIPEAGRQLLVAEIVALPEGVPGLRLYEAVAALTPHVRVVNLRLPLVNPSLTALHGVRATAVGTELPAHIPSEAQVIKSLDVFVARAARSGLHTYLHNVRSLSLATAAIGAGFDYLDGDAIARTADEPGQMYRYNTADIYARLFAGSGV